jgi:hypothetical protein
MQILYAAPFLLLAAIGFFVCVSIPRLRSHALVIPVGFLSFGVGALITFVVFALGAEKLGYKGPANWLYLAPYMVGGLCVAVISTSVYRGIVAILPLWIIRIGLFVGSVCSALVLGAVVNIAAVRYMPSTKPLWTWSIIAFVTLYVTSSIVYHAALFRPRPLHWFSERFFQHTAANRSNPSI